MANTFDILDKELLTSGQAGITFAAIPQTYNDLVIIVSAQSNQSSIVRSYNILPNGTSLISGRRMGDESGAIYTDTGTSCYLPGQDVTSTNFFSGGYIYISDYTNTTRGKMVDMQSFLENNNNNAGQMVGSGVYNSNLAITSIDINIGLGSFMPNSNFYLYGIKKS